MIGFHKQDNRPTWVDIHFLNFYKRHIQSGWMNSSSLRHPFADNRVLQFQVTHSCFSVCASFRKHRMSNKCFSLYWQWFSWLENNFSISKSKIPPKRDFVDSSLFVSISLLVLNLSPSKSKSPNISTSTFQHVGAPNINVHIELVSQIDFKHTVNEFIFFFNCIPNLWKSYVVLSK